jgi:putative spermidine/putrescine transport system permease protein
LLLPLAMDLRLSLKGFGFITGIEDNVTLEQYRHILQDSYYIRAWITTLKISAESALLTTVAGAFIAYYMWRMGGALRAYLTVAIFAPLLVSGVVRAFGWIAIIGPNGAISTLSDGLGLGKWFMPFNEPLVVLAFIHVFVPFVVIAVLVQLDAIPPTILQAAANLGANRLQVGRTVIAPLVTRSLASSFLLVFGLATASYAVPAILGGGRVLTAATIIYEEQDQALNFPRAAALGIVLTLVTMALMTSYQLLVQRGPRAMEL